MNDTVNDHRPGVGAEHLYICVPELCAVQDLHATRFGHCYMVNGHIYRREQVIFQRMQAFEQQSISITPDMGFEIG